MNEHEIKDYMRECAADLVDRNYEVVATHLGEWAIVAYGITDADEQETVYDWAVEVAEDAMS